MNYMKSDQDPYYDSMRGKVERRSEFSSLNAGLHAHSRAHSEGGGWARWVLVAVVVAAALAAVKYFVLHRA